MITTQYGSVVTPMESRGDGWIVVKRESDGALREYHASQLRGETQDDLAQIAKFGGGQRA